MLLPAIQPVEYDAESQERMRVDVRDLTLPSTRYRSSVV